MKTYLSGNQPKLVMDIQRSEPVPRLVSKYDPVEREQKFKNSHMINTDTNINIELRKELSMVRQQLEI